MNSEILDANFNKPSVNMITVLKKYALLLGIVMLVQIGVRTGAPLLFAHYVSSEMYYKFISYASMSYLVFNAIVAIVLYNDMKRYDMVSKSVIFLTLINVDAGVLFFLFLLFLQRNGNSDL